MTETTAVSLSTEWTARLLWEACRRDPDSERIRAALANGADAARAAELSVPHKIGPLLWRAMSAAGETAALGEHERFLSELAEVHRLEALLLLPRAVALAVRPLTGVGLEPVIIKGPSLASRYPEPGLRPMIDIDLLLPRAQHADALSALHSSGWRTVRESAFDRYDTVLYNSDVPSLTLELHYGLDAWYERYTALSVETLWPTRVPIDCLGTPAFGLPPEEELVMLAAHAGKPFHTFAQLIWIADLAMILNDPGGTPIDWARASDVARTSRCETVTAAALALAHSAGVESPPELFALPATGWRAAALRQMGEVTWPLVSVELGTFHLRYALTDTMPRRLWLFLGGFHKQPWGKRVSWPARAVSQAAHRWEQLRNT